MSENQSRESAEVTSDHAHDVALRNLYEYLDRDHTWHIINNYEEIDDNDANKIGLNNRLTAYYEQLGGAGSSEDAKRWAMNTISMVKGYSQTSSEVHQDVRWKLYEDRHQEDDCFLDAALRTFGLLLVPLFFAEHYFGYQ